MNCELCGHEMKKRKIERQYSVTIHPNPKKKKKKNIKICQRTYIEDHCPACATRNKAESYQRGTKKGWLAYMRRNPLYFKSLALGDDVQAAMEVMFS